jgi:cell division protein FtsB
MTSRASRPLPPRLASFDRVRVGRTALRLALIVFVGAIALRIGGQGVDLIHKLRAQQRELQALESRDASLRQENRRLLAGHRRLSSQEGALEEARALGYLKPGERSIYFVAPQPVRKPPTPPAPPTYPQQCKERLLRWLGGEHPTAR